MALAWSVTINETPPRCLAANAARRTHWGTKAKAAKALRHSAYLEASEAALSVPWSWVAGDQPLALRVTIAWEIGRRRLDDDGAIHACKPILDGVADAIGVNDARFRIRGITQTRSGRRQGYVRVELEEIRSEEERCATSLPR